MKKKKIGNKAVSLPVEVVPTVVEVKQSANEKLHQLFLEKPLAFGLFYCRNHFRLEPSYFHAIISNEAMKNRFFAIQAPRESAKSTVITFLHTLHGICFKRYRFIVIVQNTFSKAAGSLDGITTEFKENADIKSDFGVTIERDSSGDRIFRHPDGHKVRVLCKGADQIGSVRGEKFDAYRPDLIIIDDLEDDEMVRNPERRQELQQLYDEALVPAGEKGKVKIIAIGTILHDDCLIAKLVSKTEYPEYRKLFYRARYQDTETKELDSLWPEKWSVDDLNALERDKPAVFAKEYQGDPSSGSMETIRREDFRYWREENNNIVLLNEDGTVKAKWLWNECRVAIACDLAWENKQSSDFSAVVPGIITPGNDLLIDNYIAKKGMRPDELETLLFDLAARYEKLTGHRVKIGFEKAKLEKVMKWFLSEAQRRLNKWLWLVDINWGTKDKIERILARVGNRYAQNSIFHRKGQGDLENQMIRLRSVAHDDIADCVGMLPEMLSIAPKKASKPKEDNIFDFLRRQTPMYREKPQSAYIFGNKTTETIKSRITLPV